MRKTYAYNSIIIGFLIGLLVAVQTDKIVLGILAGLGVAGVGFVLIRLLEKGIAKGVDKGVDAAVNAYQKHKEKKNNQE